MGLMANHSQISGAVSVGGSAFYVPEMSGITRFIANLFFKFYVPFCLSQFDYVPLKFFGWGEDIPSGVARQWARWSLQPGHIRNSFGADIKRHFYREFHSPILVLYADTGLITDQTRIEDMSDLYRSAALKCKEIGHVNFFQKKNAKLWPMVSDWMKAPARQTVKTLTLTLKMQSHLVAVVPRAPRPDRGKAYTCTRISAQQSKFIGQGKKKVKV
jgi:predicted alpha/beta hydrolase